MTCADELTGQTQLAVDEATWCFYFSTVATAFVSDENVVAYLRKSNVAFLPVINKIDGLNEDQIVADFVRFGFHEYAIISASHNRGLKQLRDTVAQKLTTMDIPHSLEAEHEPDSIRVAVVGRPNVGKSTLVNRLIGQERQVVFDMPGTTKDAIDIPFSKDGTDYVLIDTAGVRRKGKVSEVTEKFSVVKALQAMERAHVVILVIDAAEGLVEQDLHVLEYALEAGAGTVIAVNKWDGLARGQREKVKTALDRRLNFVPWVPLQTISALHGSGVGKLLGRVEKVYQVGLFDVSTSLLTRLVRNMVAAHPHRRCVVARSRSR